MSAKVFVAIMHCTPRLFNAVSKLCTKVIKGLTDNAVTYPVPNPNPTILGTERDMLNLLISQAKGNHQKKTERDE